MNNDKTDNDARLPAIASGPVAETFKFLLVVATGLLFIIAFGMLGANWSTITSNDLYVSLGIYIIGFLAFFFYTGLSPRIENTLELSPQRTILTCFIWPVFSFIYSIFVFFWVFFAIRTYLVSKRKFFVPNPNKASRSPYRD